MNKLFQCIIYKKKRRCGMIVNETTLNKRPNEIDRISSQYIK